MSDILNRIAKNIFKIGTKTFDEICIINSLNNIITAL